MTNLPKEFNIQGSAWECPRCGRMNAPFNPSCFCKKDENQSLFEKELKNIAAQEDIRKPLFSFEEINKYAILSRCDNCGGHHGIFQGRAVQCVNLGANGGA